MYGHRTVRFHDDESDGSRQVRVESPRVVDRAIGNDETHDREDTEDYWRTLYLSMPAA